MDNIEQIIIDMGRLAKNASFKLAGKTSEEKNLALTSIAESIHRHRSHILAENFLDVSHAKASGMADALIERLTLNDKRIDAMIASITTIKGLNDPVGKFITSRTLENGMECKKVRVPIGVIGIIFESRPNVVTDVAALCLKSGNAVILRGGSEANQSNRALMKAIEEGLQKINFTPFAIQMVPTTDRKAIHTLCRLNGLIDLIIPRGGEALITAISDVATVPVIKHYKGVCHVYVDETADLEMAESICFNAKCQRPSVCNAAETFLIHQSIAHHFLPKLYQRLADVNVEMRGDEKTRSLFPSMKAALESDWSTEYLDLIVSIKTVVNLDEAINHINHYGSHHSDAIVTEDKLAKTRFIKEVDSAAVYVNASTRFTDGAVFGLGAEMGISTDKLHARGPMGLEELCTYKWVGIGNGHIRE